MSDGHRVPVLKTHVRLFEVHEDFGRVWTSCGAGWWGLLDAFIDEVTITRSAFRHKGKGREVI